MVVVLFTNQIDCNQVTSSSQTILSAGYLAPEELAILNNGLFGPMGGGGDDGNDGDVDDLGIERAFELMASLKGVGTHTIFAAFAYPNNYI
jgi:hypothetical protein